MNIQTFTPAATSEQVSEATDLNPRTDHVVLHAAAANTGNITYGKQATGIPLLPGKTIGLPLQNLKDLWVVGDATDTLTVMTFP